VSGVGLPARPGNGLGGGWWCVMMAGDRGMAGGGAVLSRAQLVAGVPLALAVSRFRFASLRRAGAHPYALVGARPGMPGILWQNGWRNGDLTDIVLAYGYPHAVSRPFIEVATCFAGFPPGKVPSLEVAMARAEHRDVLVARGEWEVAGGPFDDDTPAAVPAGGHRRDERMVSVDGAERPVMVVSRGEYAALQFGEGAVVVMAVARSGFPGELAFALTDDLEPYFAGYRRLVRGFLRPWSR